MTEGYTMYILINSDLGMGKGKIAAQVGHVVGMLTERMMQRDDSYITWKQTGHKKIVLKATQEELMQFMHDPTAEYILDAGRTQIPENSLTVVGFLPSCKNWKMFTGFKLL
jgi:PTH2 family peptidyl-tRNA hydrolase